MSDRPRVAVINDDTDFLHLMEELLSEMRDYEVITCFEGDHAYHFVKKQQPDLVILDLVMQKIDQGWRTLELLTLDPETSAIPIVVCSAATLSLSDHEQWMEQFDVHVLPKPFDLDKLLEQVDRLLGTKRGPARRREE